MHISKKKYFYNLFKLVNPFKSLKQGESSIVLKNYFIKFLPV